MTDAARRCPACAEPAHGRDRAWRLEVCPRCGHHLRLAAAARVRLLVDRGTFVERDGGLAAADPLAFAGYRARLGAARRQTGRREGILTGTARLGGHRVALAVFDFAFLGGSMGTGVGERLTRLIEHARAIRVPLVVCTASGGARLQEGIFSLMQMAKVTAALARFRQAGVPCITVLTDPTTGGVTASIGLLGDINLAEPGALIGFAGPRVIEQTLRQKPPPSFQRAESFLERGMLDRIVPARSCAPPSPRCSGC
ncbi:MAG: acetyl-CoA carboxylase carboxyl transferase subunit beta [Deltaproteobacteria bacterium]|nr:MAG: acetyl-CoA carboxylase carboxyl transferase subunit beta [Deltaproteobacteria bacterium]